MNPWTDPALACELTIRERQALMTVDDWHPLIEKELAAQVEGVSTGRPIPKEGD